MYSSAFGTEADVIRDTSLSCGAPKDAGQCAPCVQPPPESAERRGFSLKSVLKNMGAEDFLLIALALLLLDGERCADTDAAVLMLLFLLFL